MSVDFASITAGAAMVVYVGVCFGFSMAADREGQPFISGAITTLLWPFLLLVALGVHLYYWSRTRGRDL